MPTTLTGLLLFVALLLPGITYVALRERHSPARRWSTFRETGVVIAASVVANAATLLLFAMIHAVWPSDTPSLGRWIDRGSDYWGDHYSAIIGWGVAVLAGASGLAAVAALIMGKRSPHPSTVSSWWILFDDYPKRKSPTGRRSGILTTATCRLKDGTVYKGLVFDYNPALDETQDRDLTLVAPIERWAGDQRTALDAHAVCISAREIVVLEVDYEVKRDPPTTQSFFSRARRWLLRLRWWR